MSTDKPQITADQQRIVNEEMFAALEASDFTERIDLCLRKGANINARANGTGQTLLLRAVWKESPARVRYVLSKKPDLFMKDDRQRTAFDLNKETRNVGARDDITRLLMLAMPDGAVRPGQATPGHSALPRETGEDILLAPPVNVKNRKKGGGGPTGGFRL